MVKKYQKNNVFEAFDERLQIICKYFDHIVVSFSGGKDSGLMLELVHHFYKEKNLASKGIQISVFYLDYEGNYQATKDYIKRTMWKYSEFEYYHICMPISASCGISMMQPTWLPWDPDCKEIWLSDIPEKAIHMDNHCFPFFEVGMSDYTFQKKFSKWLHEKKGVKRTAILVGIRAQESLNRFRAVTREETVSKFGTIPYSSRISYNIFNFYPMYDWNFKDIWIANYKLNLDYNSLYDLYFQAGLPFKEMRVANPFHQCGVSSLKLYRALEPNTWGAMIGRVNGANFGAIYGGTSALGYKGVHLPEGHTWKSYVEFLLKTLPEKIRKIYKKKFATSIKYWTKSGGPLPYSIVKELETTKIVFEDLGIPQNNRKYKQEYRMIRFKEYPDVVNVKNFRMIPSYKRMCITILKNDTSCQYMGFGQTLDELQKKKEAMKKWETIL